MDIPIEIFLGFMGLSFAMAVMSFMPKTKQPFLLFIAGVMITFMSVTTDNIIMGKIPITSTVSGSTTTYAFIDNLFEFTQWHKILFALIGSIMLIVGAVVWKDSKESLI